MEKEQSISFGKNSAYRKVKTMSGNDVGPGPQGVPIAKRTTCPDCLYERREYGAQWCPAHYDPIKDNARAIAQTGVGIARENPDLLK
jgi:hypothetical protein